MSSAGPEPAVGVRALLSRAALVLASIALALGLAEAALRVLGADEPDGGRRGFVLPVDHPDLDYVLAPGFGRGGRSPVRINSQGFRDREYAATKPQGTRRIVVIGDSVAFGLGVAAEETFAKQLEARLADADPPTQVLNLGVGGYDVVNEVAFLAEVGLRFEPDLVVLALCINDVGIHSANARTLRWLRPGGWLADHSALARFALRRLERTELTQDLHRLNEDAEFRRRNEGRIDPIAGDAEQQARMAALSAELARSAGPPPFAAWYTSPDKIGRLRHAFARLARLSREHAFEVWVAVLPYLDEAGHAEIYRLAYEIAGHEARRAGFRVLQLRDAFAARGMARLRRRTRRAEDPLHPNAEGHRVIAEALLDALGRGDS